MMLRESAEVSVLQTIRNLDYVVLLCQDLGKMKAFYHQVMGFPIYRDWDDWIEMSVGSVLLTLRKRGRPADGPHTPGAASLQMAFRVAPKEVDACRAELARLGVAILEEPRDQDSGHRTLFFTDPENNLLEIYADL